MAMGSKKKTKKTTSTMSYRRKARPKTRHRGMVILMFLALVVVCSAAASQVWTRLRSINSGYKLTEVNAEHSRLVETNRQLKIELALLKSPARIKRIASSKLGMASPRPHQVRKLVNRNRNKAAGEERLAGAAGGAVASRRNGS